MEKLESTSKLVEGAYAMLEERNRSDLKMRKEMERHPRCALLPSPETLRGFYDCAGLDRTTTLQDFSEVRSWAEDKKLLNTAFFEGVEPGQDGLHQMDASSYGGIVQACFSAVFHAIRNTSSPDLNEVVFWYYAGHGLDPNSSRELHYSSVPQFDKVSLRPDYVLGEYSKETHSKVKGGEMCLHHLGFCGLRGLLDPWITAVRSKSIHSEGQKKNKHLVIIADSCYSGILARDLEKLNETSGQWNQNGCSVTVQAACGEDEPTFGGYFTPTFLYLNRNREKLKEWKEEWKNMEDWEKEMYRSLQLPSPVVATTCPLEAGKLTLRFNVQEVPLVLFRDAGFFKYCHHMVFKLQEEKMMNDLGPERLLNGNKASEFLQNKSFTVIDFKLMTLSTGPYKGQFMGLFLLKDPDPDLAVCAHVHFGCSGTSRIGRINLVHHKKSAMALTQQPRFNDEDTDTLSKTAIKKNRQKIQVATVPNVSNPNPKSPNDWLYWRWDKNNIQQTFSLLAKQECSMAKVPVDKNLKREVEAAMEMVTACHKFVEEKEQGLWGDATKWNMNGVSYCQMFRAEQRSANMNEKYLNHIEQYHLPIVKDHDPLSSGSSDGDQPHSSS